MHLKFIETLFDEKLLKDSINNEYNAKIIQRIGLEIIHQSFTRRSFLPTLTSKIMSYQKGYSAEFNQTFWLIEVLVKSFSLVQDESNLFRLKPVFAKIYDDELKFHGDLYEEVFGPEEVSAKINVIIILVTSSVEFTNEFFQNLIQDDKYSLLTPNKKANGTEERQRISSFALLLLVSRQIDPERLSNIVAKYLLPSLVEESSPLVRSYIEWIVSIDMINSDVNREALFGYFKDQSKPALVTSVERIAFMTAQKLPSPENVSYFDRFTQFLIPNCTSNKPLIRHFSNSLILSVFPELISKKIELPVHSVLEALYIEAKKSEVTGQYRSGDALIWDVEDDFTLTSIFGGVLSKISPREVDAISQAEFEKYYQNEAGKVEVGSDYRSNWKTSTEDQLSTSSNVNSPLQTKSGAWESVIDLDENTRSIKRSELIVVSSLVDKPPNLGGICRLCDVLGAGLMTVDDLRVKKHPQFKNVAVTADYWMPITEVQIKDIPKFMKSKKREGYTLIGLEQTDQSIVLGKDTEFPSKSLILLGREAEGIPGELLAELDYCIEIRQMGVIRSMNIQTATAVIFVLSRIFTDKKISVAINTCDQNISSPDRRNHHRVVLVLEGVRNSSPCPNRNSFFEYPPVGARIVSLVASVIVATASGTPYVYSVFAPQLVKNSKLPVSSLSNLSLALALGGACGGFPAGLMIDKFGPGPADFIGSIFQFTAFTLLHKIYTTQSQNIPLLMLALACVGFGSILSFYSTVKCATANFPHHRGTAGALPGSVSSFSQENRPLLAPELRRADSSVIYSAVEDVPVFVREHSPIWNHYIVKAICQRLFLKYYFILASLQGIGQMYIYSVGFIVVAQVNSTPNKKLTVGQSQALQVSTIAIASFLGRLTSGPISDVFRRKFHAQRIWCIFFASSLMGLGQHLTSIFDSVEQITLCSFITGFAFGFVFGTFPAVVADRFGTEGFSTIWGLMTTGGIITVSQLTKLFGYYLGKHTDEDGVCRAGLECYREAFVFTKWASLFISALLLLTIYINHRLGTKG
ncbi:unnamed protein product [Wickerhamomyces anomalus]